MANLFPNLTIGSVLSIVASVIGMVLGRWECEPLAHVLLWREPTELYPSVGLPMVSARTEGILMYPRRHAS